MENLYRLKLALSEAESLFRNIDVYTVALLGSVARGEATRSDDIDLLVVLGKTEGVGHFQRSKKLEHVPCTETFVSREELNAFLRQNCVNDWPKYRLLTRLRDAVFLFSREPSWNLYLKSRVKKIKPSQSFIRSHLESAEAYLDDAEGFMRRGNLDLSLIAARASMDCLKLVLFVKNNEELGGLEWELSRLKLLNKNFYGLYKDVFLGKSTEARHSLQVFKHFLKTLKIHDKLKALLDKDDLEILVGLEKDAETMLFDKKNEEALIILRKSGVVICGPDYKIYEHLRSETELYKQFSNVNGFLQVMKVDVEKTLEKVKEAYDLIGNIAVG